MSSVNKLVSQKWKFSLPNSCFVGLFCNTLDGWIKSDKIRGIFSKFEIFYQQLFKKRQWPYMNICGIGSNECPVMNSLVLASNCIWNRPSSCPDFLLNFWKHFLSCSIVIAHITQVFLAAEENWFLFSLHKRLWNYLVSILTSTKGNLKVSVSQD